MPYALRWTSKQVLQQIRRALPDDQVEVKELGEAETDEEGTTVVMVDVKIRNNQVHEPRPRVRSRP